ncbi:MAG: GTPase Era, partial [Oscillospiraceae bacterium]|nr:GTPase Era [Oscillospiraceae bacterium]
MTTRSAFVSIVGRPNVGKSTLLNALVGERVAIVSPKPQTTRTRVTGILTRGDDQLVFIDTPGIHAPKTGLSRYMVEEIKRAMSGVDVAVLVSDARGAVHHDERELLSRLKESRVPVILALNKIDALSQKEDMLEKIAAFSALYDFAEIIPIRARKNDGLEILTQAL